MITSQNGDLQGNTNTAKNVVLQDVNGDWTMESKLVFSRPLANNNEQGGIIAYNSDQNYVKLAWEMSAATQPINRLRVVRHPRAERHRDDAADHRAPTRSRSSAPTARSGCG